MAQSKRIRIVCISDTHNKSPGEGYTLPKGDVLIHAGDITNEGSHHELQRAAEWLQKADYAAKIIVAGNHDLSLDPKRNSNLTGQEDSKEYSNLLSSIPDITYFEHSSATISLPEKDISFRVFGSPYSALRPISGRYTAFQYSSDQGSDVWNTIPSDLDILITHTPPKSICDQSFHWPEGGCPALMGALGRVKPVLHICGHCHEGRGGSVVRWNDDGTLESVKPWVDPGAGLGNKKMCSFDLTGKKGGRALERGRETAVVNASMVIRDATTGSRRFNKPIVVDILL
jgi:Icc-related predicted phosphoesterase